MKNVNTQAKLAKDLRVGDTFEVVLFRRKLIAVVKKIDTGELIAMHALSVKIEWQNEYHEAR